MTPEQLQALIDRLRQKMVDLGVAANELKARQGEIQSVIFELQAVQEAARLKQAGVFSALDSSSKQVTLTPDEIKKHFDQPLPARKDRVAPTSDPANA